MNDKNNYIPSSLPFFNDVEANIIETIENDTIKATDTNVLKGIVFAALDLYKREVILMYMFRKNYNNFLEVYMKNDIDKVKYINDVNIMTSRNYNDFCEVYGGQLEGAEKPAYLFKDDNGEYLDIHRFD